MQSFITICLELTNVENCSFTILHDETSVRDLLLDSLLINHNVQKPLVCVGATSYNFLLVSIGQV